jgi:hypothetical protein
MKTVTTVSNIELTKEECQVLYDRLNGECHD